MNPARSSQEPHRQAYAVENALFQWEEGERRVRGAAGADKAWLERAVGVVLDELRRRLGSSFTLEELASFYAAGVDWAADLAQREWPRADSSWVVDAAFGRYARGAVNFGGGRRRVG
jgi:hypothetical protein